MFRCCLKAFTPSDWCRRFPEVALQWFQALLTDCDAPRHGVDLFGRDALLLGRLLATLGRFVVAAAPAPVTAQVGPRLRFRGLGTRGRALSAWPQCSAIWVPPPILHHGWEFDVRAIIKLDYTVPAAMPASVSMASEARPSRTD